MNFDPLNKPNKFIKKTNYNHPSFLSSGMTTIMKPQCKPQEIPQKSRLLYFPPNQLLKSKQLSKSLDAKTGHINESILRQMDKRILFNKFVNPSNPQTIKKIQYPGYNIISNII